MNYLGHLCLSDDSPECIVGNLLGDFVKGRPEGRFPPGVVRGIRLHRAIDGFTDGHPWLPVAVEHLRLAVAEQERDAGSMLHFYRAMLGFRRAHPANGGVQKPGFFDAVWLIGGV